MLEKTFEYIVIGSGPSGAMAAQTLCEAGAEVAMIDVGQMPSPELSYPPENDFLTLRRNDPSQQQYFIGKSFEAVPDERVKTGAQLTPARKYMIEQVEHWLPLQSDNFFPMESLACGGLGVGWGLGTYVYSDEELQLAGLTSEEMRPAYQTIADRIGISAPNDSFREFVVQHLNHLQPPLKPDNSIQKLIEKYQKKKEYFQQKGFYMGLPAMALLSQNKETRKPTAYRDMDFYDDLGYSAWRPWMTIQKLQTNYQHFNYLNNNLAISFKEVENEVEVHCIDVRTKQKVIWKGKNVLLSAGALGSARIALRSLPVDSLPLLCNPYTYLTCLHISMLGKPLSNRKTSMAQAMALYIPGNNQKEIVSLAFYTYRSLLLFKLIKETPLNHADGLRIMNRLQSAFVITGIHHPDFHSPFKKLSLQAFSSSPTGDRLCADYQLTEDEKHRIIKHEKKVRSLLRQIDCFPLKRIDPGAGSSIHYAGTLPVSVESKPGTTRGDGLIHGCQKVWIADASSFSFLPAKGITLSLMANAHRVATNALKNNRN